MPVIGRKAATAGAESTILSPYLGPMWGEVTHANIELCRLT